MTPPLDGLRADVERERARGAALLLETHAP